MCTFLDSLDDTYGITSSSSGSQYIVDLPECMYIASYDSATGTSTPQVQHERCET
jgi:hypothetical protein